MRPLLAVALAILFVPAATAAAQDDLARIRRSIGDEVDITDANGVVLSGVLRDVTPSSIAVDGHELALDSVLEVQRHGDPIWNGTLIGAAVGLVLSPVSAEACLDGSRLPCVLGPMAAYGAIGALWDRLHVGRQTIYRRPHTTSLRVAFVPVISPHVQGFGVRWSF